MRDITLEDTIYIGFTTRAFATGIPGTLSGTPVLSVLEENNATPITAGVSVSVDRASVTGLNEATIVATAANGYEAGKGYSLYVSTGTVGGVSAIGEVVGQFTVSASAAQTTIGTAGAGLTAITLPNQTMDITGNITGNVSGSVGSVTGAVGSVAGAVGSLAAQAKLDVNAECDTALTDYGANTTTPLTAAQVNAECDTAMTDYDAPTKAEMDTAFTEIKGATWASGTDTLEAIRDRGDSAWTTGAGGSDRLLMVDTTIATLASQVSFTLTAGSTDNDAYNNCTIVIEDVSTATQKAVGIVSDYVGSTKTVTLKYDPSIFTMATTDKVYILAENALKSTAANRQLDVTATGAAGIDWGNVENQSTAVSMQGTDIKLVTSCVTTTTNTDMRGTDSAALASEVTSARMATLTDWIDGGRLDLLLDAIPTTAMRGTDSAGTAVNLATVDGVVDAIKAVTDLLPDAGALTTIGTDTARLTAVRAAVLTDWINAGRLDVILDAIKAKTDNQPEGIQKNATLSNFEILMVDSTDHVTPKTGLTVTGQRSVDGGAFANVAGTIAEVGSGIYQFDALAADTNGDLITWKFNGGATADDAFVTFKTVV